MVALTINARQMDKLQRTVGRLKDGVPKALVPAINRTIQAGRTAVRREIRKEYLIKQKDIPIKVRRATRATLGAEIRIQQGMLALSKFKVTPKGLPVGSRRRPIRAQVKVRGGGGIISRAFNVQFEGPVAPYQRRTSSRLPIRKLLAIGAGIMASQPNVGPAANKTMGETLDKRIDHEIKRLMSAGA
jgi:hypothetical protein